MKTVDEKSLQYQLANGIEKELEDKFILWFLRIAVKLNGLNDLDKRLSLDKDELAFLMGVGEDELKKYRNSLKRQDFLAKRLEVFEKKNIPSMPALQNNILKLSKFMQFNQYEQDILEFAILLEGYSILRHISDLIVESLNSKQLTNILSVVLDIPIVEIEKSFAIGSSFSNSSILGINRMITCIKNKFEFISSNFSSKMLLENENIDHIFNSIVMKCQDSKLVLEDFDYLKSDLLVIKNHLHNALKKKKKGVNILFYGDSGTGKTELAKAIAKELHVELHEVAYENSSGECIDRERRLKSFKAAQSFLQKNETLLMFDEIEDIFNADTKQYDDKNKAWINRALENNKIPSIWITNDVYAIDEAIIRRFDMSMEIPIPKKRKRKEILARYSNSQIDEETISKIASSTFVSPAMVSSAAEVVKSVKEEKNRVFKMLINNTLKAQGYPTIATKKSKKKLKQKAITTYDLDYINSSVNLQDITCGIMETKNARVCIYGPAGTGKSEWAKYLAKKMKKKIIIKKGSDILSMWVGGTEKNIANAFKEAKKKKAVLVFDEVDGFLADRSGATKNWEVTQVNEMLTQMESFDGIFIATTNLMENLDKASLRRFDIKLEFGFLKPAQAEKLFRKECKKLNIKVQEEEFLLPTKALAPGDFAAVLRQNRFNPIKNSYDFMQRLRAEVQVKDMQNASKVGFVC